MHVIDPDVSFHSLVPMVPTFAGQLRSEQGAPAAFKEEQAGSPEVVRLVLVLAGKRVAPSGVTDTPQARADVCDTRVVDAGIGPRAAEAHDAAARQSGTPPTNPNAHC